MKKRLFLISLLFCAIILITAGFFYGKSRKAHTQNTASQRIIAINELEQLALLGDLDTLSEQADRLQAELRTENETDENYSYFLLCGICMLFVTVVFFYVYFAILKPFENMKRFAEKIAQGNLDIPLDYERSNYFGDFTWAFDSMRREITKARSCEKEAVENNKTVIATLSHDIKTPIASIRAYAEGLEANLDTSAERRNRYLRILMRKCDEVSKLTNDLFLHSVSDLDKLKITMEEFELSGFIRACADELCAESDDIRLSLPTEKIIVRADKNRLMQVCENLINNARKYAKTTITLSVLPAKSHAEIHFRDYGSGIPDEDIPFIFGKFYRGKNCQKEQGSGLGLYIVKYITEKMDGQVFLHNHPDGLEAVVFLRTP